MSIALDLPAAVEQDVRYCANARGISFAQFVFELVEKEAAQDEFLNALWLRYDFGGDRNAVLAAHRSWYEHVLRKRSGLEGKRLFVPPLRNSASAAAANYGVSVVRRRGSSFASAADLRGAFVLSAKSMPD